MQSAGVSACGYSGIRRVNAVKVLKNGIILGELYWLIHLIFTIFARGVNSYTAMFFGGLVFLYIIVNILTKSGVCELFLTGFAGLFTMLVTEAVTYTIFINKLIEIGLLHPADWLMIYVSGFLAATAGVIISLAVILLGRKIKEAEYMETDVKTKIKLAVYSMVTALTFLFLVMPENSGLGILIFTLTQSVAAFFILDDREKILYFIPIVIFGINAFVSANASWRIPNAFAACIILALMNINASKINSVKNLFCQIAEKIFEPFMYFNVPFKWISEIKNQSASVFKRVIKALVISVPCVVVLLLVLSGADMVFGKILENSMGNIFDEFGAVWILKAGVSVIAALYLFGVMLIRFIPEKGELKTEKSLRTDTLVLNIVLCTIVAVYMLFSVVQFKYLFAQGTLPYGLIYSQYARKGFFELLALTGVNIALIVFSVYATKQKENKFTKALCCLLCTATCVLLASSFFRMRLYCADAGLTRMRFMVLTFLAFEAFGLCATFIYIIKPKFNISLIYIYTAVVYYLFLNLAPMDAVVAKSQIERYFAGDNSGISYVVCELSADAYPQVKRLLGTDEEERARTWIGRMKREKDSFVAYNLSYGKFE